MLMHTILFLNQPIFSCNIIQWEFYILGINIHAFSILYGHTNVPLAGKELRILHKLSGSIVLLSNPLCDILSSKFPQEILSSDDTMQLLALCATRIEHMQVVTTY